MNTRPLQPSSASVQPGYPSLGGRGAGRRRFLKLFALSSAAAALGLDLIGCPAPGGSGNAPNTPPVPTPPGYVPWEPEHLAGDVAMPMGTPVAVVVGGGPIAVTFKDGAKVELVVAGILRPTSNGTDPAADMQAKAKEHADLVRKTASGHDSTTLGDAQAIQALEQAILAALNQTMGGSYFEELSLAEAGRKQPAKEDDRADAQPMRDSAPMDDADMANADMAEGDMARDPAPAAPPRAATPLKAKTLWTPCRRPGCKNCKG
jgi:hypothetical protein